ncbi:MAG: YdcF family protein [Bacillota bacterium]
MKKLFVTVAIIAVIAVPAYATSPLWLTAMGKFLVIDEQPRKSDAIVIISGENVPRVARGAELYREGYGDTVILSGGGRPTSKLSDADLMLMEAMDRGVPRDAVILEGESRSTYENAACVKRIIQERNIKSFILVTSSYHTRRAKYVFKRVFEDTGVNFITVAAPDPVFDPENWWKTHEGQQKVLTEYFSIIIYRFKY